MDRWQWLLWSCEGTATSALFFIFLFFPTGFADGIGWELGRMSPQYLETFSWCLRWFFLVLSCVSYSIWEMDTLSQVKTLMTTVWLFTKMWDNKCVCAPQDLPLHTKSITGSAVHARYQCPTSVYLQNYVHNVLSLMTYISYLALPDSSTERDLQKVLQQLEPQISFLEELTKMGGAMRTVLTKILTNQQTFKELCMGKYINYTICVRPI